MQTDHREPAGSRPALFVQPDSVMQLLERTLAGPLGSHEANVVFPTGFDPLDAALGGGVGARDLMIVGGRPGVGKTIAALQWARSIAMQGPAVVFACYEHAERALLARLFALELGTLARPDELATLDRVRGLASGFVFGTRSLDDLLSDPLGEEAYGRIRSYAGRLHLVRASGVTTGLPELAAMIEATADGIGALFVDYLQKVPVAGVAEEAERVHRVVCGLKELALSGDVAVVAVAAADRPGADTRRARLHHLHGAVSLEYEADVALLLNQKSLAVSKAHLAYDGVRAEAFRRYVVFSIEKNRNGPAPLDLEFRKDFVNYRFETNGQFVAEALVDDLLVGD